MIFRDSKIAHQYLDSLNGIEIGAAAHNPFNLPFCINVTRYDDFAFYKNAQLRMCGTYTKVDVYADAAVLPFADSGYDYVISSHMIEHHPDPIAVFREWNRVVKDGGIIFMIFPKRNADPKDRTREVSTLSEIVSAYIHGTDITDKDLHCYVYTLQSMEEVIQYLNRTYFMFEDVEWRLLIALETDDKVGNGHCLVYQVRKGRTNDPA